MNKRVAFTILVISAVFLILLTFFRDSNALIGMAIKTTNLNYDNLVFGFFILFIGIIVATGYYLKKIG
ncbi:MAG: hypothetical protein AABW41_04090 [Nanoarchaeota archaeon]